MEELRKERKRLLKELKHAKTKCFIIGRVANAAGHVYPCISEPMKYANKKYMQASGEFLAIMKKLDEVDKKIHEESLRRFEARKREREESEERREVRIKESAPIYKAMVKHGHINPGDILTVESHTLKRD